MVLSEKEVEDLDVRELGRGWGPHLVQLKELVRRATAQVFGELSLVVELCASPEATDFDRKKRIIDYVIHSRRQIIKLLVIVKWSAHSEVSHKLMSVVSFLQRQNQQFERTVNILKACRENFHRSRLRNYDLLSALRVLSTGQPTLPLSLLETYGTKPPLTDSDVTSALSRLNDVLRWRLATQEALPAEWRRYEVRDGKAWFTIEGLVECSLTVGGEGEGAGWYLITVEFLFRVEGPRGQDYSSSPTGELRDNILNAGCQQLLPPPAPTDAASSPPSPHRPLMRIFTFLRRLALNYQLEALHAQAKALETTRWATHVRVERPAAVFSARDARQSLTLSYWVRARPHLPSHGPQQQRIHAGPHPTAPQGSITISVETASPTLSRARVLAVLAGHPSGTSRDVDGDPALLSQRLVVSWKPVGVEVSPQDLEEVQAALSDPAGSSSSKGGGKHKAKAQENGKADLSLEAVLRAVARVHKDRLMRAAVEALRVPVNSPPGFLEARLVAAEDMDPGEDEAAREEPRRKRVKRAAGIHVKLQDQHAIDMGMDVFSGRWTWRLADDATAQARTLAKGAFERINDSPEIMREMLVRLRSMILLDEVESHAAYLGLPSVRRLAVNANECFGTGGRTVGRAATFFPLPHHPLHYLLLVIHETGLRCSLLVVGEPDHAEQGRNFHDFLGNWVLRVKEVGDGNGDPFSLRREELAEVYWASLTRVTYNALARQLAARRIPLKWVSSTGATASTATHAPPALQQPQRHPLTSIPILCIPTASALGTNLSNVVYPIIAIRVLDPLAQDGATVVFHARLSRPLTGEVPSEWADEVAFNPPTGILSFTSSLDDTVIERALEALGKNIPFGRAVAMESREAIQVKIKDEL